MRIAETDFTYENSYNGIYLRVTVHDAESLQSAFNGLEGRIKMEKARLKVE